jgi:predicted ATPase
VLSDKRTVADNVLVYFVEKFGQRSQFRPLRINEFGALTAWPSGFFDENQDTAAAILEAAMTKRKRSESHSG